MCILWARVLSAFACKPCHISAVQPVCRNCHWRVDDDVRSKLNPVNLAKMVAEVQQRHHREPMNQQAMHVALQALHSMYHMKVRRIK